MFLCLLLLSKAFLGKDILESGGGAFGGYGLYILAQTGFMKSGSDLECLHASVGEKHRNV